MELMYIALRAKTIASQPDALEKQAKSKMHEYSKNISSRGPEGATKTLRFVRLRRLDGGAKASVQMHGGR